MCRTYVKDKMIREESIKYGEYSEQEAIKQSTQ